MKLIKNYLLIFWILAAILINNIYSYEINVEYAGKSENPDIIRIVQITGKYTVNIR